MTEDTRSDLRSSLRQDRRNLTPEQQEAAAQALFDLIRDQNFFRDAQHIAFYKAVDGANETRSGFSSITRGCAARALPVFSRLDIHRAAKRIKPSARDLLSCSGCCGSEGYRQDGGNHSP